MTEAEWNECAHPRPMLEFLRGKISDRKLRLFAVACCRLALPLLDGDPRPGWVLEIVEESADDPAFQGRLELANKTTWAIRDDLERRLGKGVYARELSSRSPSHVLAHFAHTLLMVTSAEITYRDLSGQEQHIGWVAVEGATEAVWLSGGREAEVLIHRRCQADLLRCIVGQHLHPVSLNSTWLTSTVTGLAESIYQDRSFDRLPILADALEDAGCNQPDILGHLRSGGEHCRGCWAVDLVTGRE